RSRAPVPPRHCTFDVRDWEILSRYWHPVAFASDVTDRPLAVTLLDERVVLLRSGGAIVAARDVCPHRGAPL
ncbi:Rieske 2Fe-2S domain-containing protein, partial [Escherichia coli]|nr:Rieske 2Fe-2S domain-containing protein [Escherichia coli]